MNNNNLSFLLSDSSLIICSRPLYRKQAIKLIEDVAIAWGGVMTGIMSVYATEY